MSTSPRQVLRPMRSELALDADAVQRFLATELGLFLEGEIQQFGHGQSNPTYFLRASGQELVIRKKPPGKLLPSAHSVDREYAVIRALAATAVPVPRVRCLCLRHEVLGTPFYVMDFVDGGIFLDPALPGLAAEARRGVYRAMCDALAKLHSVSPAAVGLQAFGRPANYNARQAARWLKQYTACTAAGSGNPRQGSMLRLAEWLQAHAPERDAALGDGGIVHGDFRLDNLVMDAQGRSVRAILDWELSTIGDTMTDVAYNCLAYHLPDSVAAIGRLPTPLPPGVPTEAEYRAAYCAARGILEPPRPIWTFYLALALFRAAAILAGVHARALQGNASASNAAAVGSPAIVNDIANAALKLIHNAASEPAPGPPGAVRESSAQNARDGLEAGPAGPGFAPSARCAALLTRLRAFLSQHVAPADAAFEAHARGEHRWRNFPQMESLKAAARTEGLWNLWISRDLAAAIEPAARVAGVSAAETRLLCGPQLSNLDYAYLAREMGEFPWCPEVFNCSAPDTGNMEVLARYGSSEQQARWLLPLLRGDIRSCFAMTEKAVASSDATNVQGTVRRDGDCYVVSGLKCWISGACDPRCAVAIFMGKNDPGAAPHRQQCMVLVPMATPGVRVIRPMTVFGDPDAPHGHAEMEFDAARVPLENMILGEGRGFEIAQGRLGPGRLHHCMRVIGIGEAALRLAAARVLRRKTFGRPLAEQSLVQAQLAQAWLQLHAAWLAVQHAAAELDRVGNKAARLHITAAKVLAPQAVLQAVDAAIQLHGAAGVGQDTKLAGYWGAVRTLRLADGPDEVHLLAIGKQTINAYSRL